MGAFITKTVSSTCHYKERQVKNKSHGAIWKLKSLHDKYDLYFERNIQNSVSWMILYRQIVNDALPFKCF